MPGLWARSPIGGAREATDWCFSPLSPSLPLSKNELIKPFKNEDNNTFSMSIVQKIRTEYIVASPMTEIKSMMVSWPVILCSYSHLQCEHWPQWKLPNLIFVHLSMLICFNVILFLLMFLIPAIYYNILKQKDLGHLNFEVFLLYHPILSYFTYCSSPSLRWAC